MTVKVIIQKTGGIWHGTVEGFRDLDERGLTAEIAERKVIDALRHRLGDSVNVSIERMPADPR
jgi:hypothetical protein